MTVGRKPKSIRVGIGPGVVDGLSGTAVTVGGIAVSVRGGLGVCVSDGFGFEKVDDGVGVSGVTVMDRADESETNAGTMQPKDARIKTAQIPRRMSKNFGRFVFMA